MDQIIVDLLKALVAMLEFREHKPRCRVNNSFSTPLNPRVCNCGYDETLKAYNEAKKDAIRLAAPEDQDAIRLQGGWPA